MGCLGGVVWNSPTERFLKMGGVLALGLGSLVAASFI